MSVSLFYDDQREPDKVPRAGTSSSCYDSSELRILDPVSSTAKPATPLARPISSVLSVSANLRIHRPQSTTSSVCVGLKSRLLDQGVGAYLNKS